MSLEILDKIYMGAAKPSGVVPVGGNVISVNGEEPDSNGNVVISGANINATVGGTTDSITDHLTTIKNDEDELGDQVSTIEGKIPSSATSSNQLVTESDISNFLDKTDTDEQSIAGNISLDADLEVMGDTIFSTANPTCNSSATLAELDDSALPTKGQITVVIPVASVEVRTTVPTTASTEVGKVILYNGTTTSSFTNGYVYKCADVVTTAAVPESLTVTQGSGTNMEITSTDLSVFKSAMNPTRTWTYTFSCVGKPSVIQLSRYVDTFEFLTLTRDSIFDNSREHIYSWVDETNNYYYTTTDIPNEETIFYEQDPDQVGQPSQTNSGWEMFSITSRASTGNGIWTIGSDPTPINLADYGIYSPETGFIGYVLNVTYTKAVAQVNSIQWARINVQPLDLTAVSGYDATKTQTLKNTSGSIAWVDDA